MRIVISSGHGRHIRGASGLIDEVFEARRVVDQVARDLQSLNVEVTTFHDDTSTSQNENLHRIVDFHNSHSRDLDISVHFNAYVETTKPMGTEVLYVTQDALASETSAAISNAAGFINRGAKFRGDLFFLNNTEEPAILIETCFVDSSADVDLYQDGFDAICRAIATSVSGNQPARPERPPQGEALLHVRGPCSWFGGPDDHDVDADEGLAFIYSFDTHRHLFLPSQPPGTTGLARRLDPDIFYVACRWDYDRTPKEMLADHAFKALITANGKSFLAYPADWGPHDNTGRVADLSQGLMDVLGLSTDDTVEVTYPSE